MKKVFRKFLALTMAVVVLMTTMSFTVDMHYCGDTMVDFSFMKQAKTCGMQAMQTSLSCSESFTTTKSCCTDKHLVVEGQEDFQLSLDKLTLEQQVFIVAFTQSYLQRFIMSSSEDEATLKYTPPLIKQNVLALYQTFLI